MDPIVSIQEIPRSNQDQKLKPELESDLIP